MNVCMMVYSFYESDNRVRRYAEALVGAGNRVDVLSLRQERAPRHCIISGVNVYQIQRRALNERHSIDYLLRLLSFFMRSFVLVGILGLRRRYRLVHVHSVPDFQVFAAVPAKLLGARVILDIHDIVPELFCEKFHAAQGSRLFRLLVAVERLSCLFADHVIVANHLWGERIAKRSARPEKVSVVMNFPDPGLFGPRGQPRAEAGFTVLYPGTLSRHQGLETAIEAVARARADAPGLVFDIYGKGTDERMLRELAATRGLDGVVRFHGPIPMETVARKMTEADVGIEPKLKTGFGNEAFSTKILEFMLAGVPVMASDTLIHQRYIDSSLVRYFQSGSVDSCAEALMELYRNGELRTRLATRGRDFVREWTWDRRKSEYLSLAARLTSRRRDQNVMEKAA